MKILILCHIDLVPTGNSKIKKSQRDSCDWITEYDVYTNLVNLGYDVQIFGVWKSVIAIENLLHSFKPNLVFNLMEEFNDKTENEHSARGLIEMLGYRCTGASSKNLLICRDKSLTKTILQKNNILTPAFITSKLSKALNKSNLNLSEIRFPVIVKCLAEEASKGLSKASIVKSTDKMIERVNWLKRKYKSDVICEEFIEGTDIFVGAIINDKDIYLLPAWRVFYHNSKRKHSEIYGEKEKWHQLSRQKKGIRTGPLVLAKNKLDLIYDECRKAIKALELTGYARIDLRLNKNWQPFILEVNPNPNIAKDDEFALSAKYAGFDYENLLQAIVSNKPKAILTSLKAKKAS